MRPPAGALPIRDTACGPGRAKTRRCLPPPNGFTLIELVISTALMAMILGGAYACLQAGLSSRAIVDSREEILQNARVAISMITADLRAACPLSKDAEFVGMHRMLGNWAADNLDFATHNYSPRRPAESDWAEVSYFLDRDPMTGRQSLWRRRDPTPDNEPFSGGAREEIAQGLKALQFEYYDGWDWYEDWGDPDKRAKSDSSWRLRPNVAGLPEAVRITLWFDPNPPRRQEDHSASEADAAAPPLAFESIVRLELTATVSQLGTSSSSSTTGAPPASGAESQPPVGGPP